MHNIKFGSQAGTGANIDIELGWIPSHVRVVNITSATIEELEWFSGMASASAIKTVTGTVARTKITTLGITPLSATFLGFRIGADTDVNVSGETIVWIAERSGLGSGA
jgi:hypothetical protein